MNNKCQSLNCELWKGVRLFISTLFKTVCLPFVMPALQNTLYRVFFPLPLNVHSFFLLFSVLTTCSTQHGLRTPHWPSFLPSSDSPSLYVHHSWRWLRQHRDSVVGPVGFQRPAETGAGPFVRKWFSRCWGGHSKSSLAISVMALRCCCLCPVMVTDDWLGRRGPARRPSKGRTSLHVHTHTQTLA